MRRGSPAFASQYPKPSPRPPSIEHRPCRARSARGLLVATRGSHSRRSNREELIMDASRFLSKILLSASLLVFGTASAWAQDGTVLALGDSVVFGYITQDGFAYVNAANFIGYPSYVGSALNFDVVNASCPGETTGSFLSSTAPDNGCRAFRGQAPLHVAYTG